MPAVFEFQAILGQVHQMTLPLTLKGQSYPIYLHVTTANKSQISLSFTLWLAIFELQASLRPVH